MPLTIPAGRLLPLFNQCFFVLFFVQSFLTVLSSSLQMAESNFLRPPTQSTKESAHKSTLTFAAIWDPEEGMKSYHGDHLLRTPMTPFFSVDAAGPHDDSTIDNAAMPYSISYFDRRLRSDRRESLCSLDLVGLDSARYTEEFELVSPIDSSDTDSESDETCHYTPVLERPSNVPWAKPHHRDRPTRPKQSGHLDIPDQLSNPFTPSSTLTFAAVWDPEEGMTAFSGPSLFDPLCPTPQKVHLHTPGIAHTADKDPASSSFQTRSKSSSGCTSGSRPSLGTSSSTSYSSSSSSSNLYDPTSQSRYPPLPPKPSQPAALGRGRSSSLDSKPLPPPPPPPPSRDTRRERPSMQRVRSSSIPKMPKRQTTLVLTEQDIEDLTTIGVADLECEIGLLLSQPPINTWYCEMEEGEGASTGGCSRSEHTSIRSQCGHSQVDQFDPIDCRADPRGNSRFSVDTFVCDAGPSQQPCQTAEPFGDTIGDFDNKSILDEGFYEAIADVYGHDDCEPHLPSRFSMTTTSTTNYLQVEVSSETSSINPDRVLSRRRARVPPASAFHRALTDTSASTDPSGHPSHFRTSRSDEGGASADISGSTYVPRGLRRRATTTTLNRLSKAIGKWTRVAKHEEHWVWVEVRPVIRERMLVV